MITANPHAKDPYWDNAAKTLLQGLMMFVATAPLGETIEFDKAKVQVRERTMAEVRRLLTKGPQGFRDMLIVMQNSPEDWVSETAGTMLQMAEAREQFAGVKSVLMEHTTIWSYERVKRVTAKTEFSFDRLRARGKDGRPATFYFSIPFENLPEYRPLARVMTGVATRQLRETWSAEDEER